MAKVTYTCGHSYAWSSYGTGYPVSAGKVVEGKSIKVCLDCEKARIKPGQVFLGDWTEDGGWGGLWDKAEGKGD